MMQTNPSHDSAAEHLSSLRHVRERTYLPDAQAPYHGVSHPDAVWEKASILIERCERLGISVDKVSLHYAIELHDALCHLDPTLLGFSSAEQLSAVLTQRYLVSRGYSQEAANTVSTIIMATHPDVRPRTTEEIIIRAADIWNIGSTYQGFVQASRALHQEAMNAKQTSIPFESFLQGSYGYLQKFLWPLLELTPEARDSEGRSVWHMNAMRNLTRQWTETFGPETPVIAEFFPEGEISSSRLTGRHTFYIAMHPDEQCRKDSLGTTKRAVADLKGAAFVIPASPSAFSLPDEVCTSVILRNPSLSAVREALRVSKAGGSIILPMTRELDSNILEVARALLSVTIEPSDEGDPATLIIFKSVAP